MVSRFVEVFRDLGSFSEVLQTQLELLLCERLTQTWVKVGRSSAVCSVPSQLGSMCQHA